MIKKSCSLSGIYDGMKRLIVYCFYDHYGIVDDYVYYFLNTFKPLLSDLCVVVNGRITNDACNKLKQIADKLLIRENVGFDSTAYKYALESYGYETLKKYDEIIFANSTVYGPVYPLNVLFEKMEKIHCDFWGITKHVASNSTMAGKKINEHVQSYFVVFRKNIVSSSDFEEFWTTLQVPANYEEAVAFYELRLTEFFESRGYKAGSFVDIQKYEKKLKKKPYYYFTLEQVEQDKMPFIKRKVFFVEDAHLKWKIDKGVIDLLSFIEKNTTYDIKLILENIKRTMLTDSVDKEFIKDYLFLTYKMCTSLCHAKRYFLRRSTIKEVKKLVMKINEKCK